MIVCVILFEHRTYVQSYALRVMYAGWLNDYLWQMDPRIENEKIGSAEVRFRGAHSVRNTLKYTLTVSEYRFYSVVKSYRGAKLFACC